MARKILITGGTGFVGAALVRRLIADGHDVHLLVRASHATWRMHGIEGDVRVHVCDMTDAASIGSLVTDIAPDAIAHLAVYGAYSSQQDVQQMLRTNIEGTSNLLEAAIRAGCERFVNTGSSSEYGFQDSAPSEQVLPEPNSHYAATKVAATMLCRRAATSSDLFAPTVRLYSIYGPWEEPTRLVPQLVLRALRGGYPPLVSPDIARDFVYIDDAVDAYVRLLAVDPGADRGRVYNIASGIQVTLADLVDVARRCFAIDAAPEWGSMEARAWDTPCWVGDPARAAQELGWRAGTSLAEGLQGFARWLDADVARRGHYDATLEVPA